MTFSEKSAWLMTLALLAASSGYLSALLAASELAGTLPPPSVPALVEFTVVLVLISIVGHILIAALRPDDANAPMDERERQVVNKAGNWSGFVLGFGLVSGLLSYLVLGNGNLLFYTVFASLLAAQFAEYLLQIVLLRWSS